MKEKLVDKYRPKSLDEIVGQELVVSTVKAIIERGVIPHMLFIGPPGTGKTSTAEAMAREIWGEGWKNHFMEFNASDERGIDFIREKIKRHALSRGVRIIFLDEADALTQDAQQALRRIMEKTMGSTFILSCNMDYKLIDPIKSRCSILVFNPLPDKVVFKQLYRICKKEGIVIEKEQRKGFIKLVKEARGDMRKAINMLEQIITSGKGISAANVALMTKPKIAGKAMQMALDGDFSTAKELIQEAYIQTRNVDTIINELYEKIESLKDDFYRANLYIRLSKTEYYCKHLQVNPLIQLVAFISYAWVLPNLPRSCPLLGDKR